MSRKNRKLTIIIAIVAVIVGGSAAAWLALRHDPPPIVLISVDTLRADHLSAYGYHRKTPNIDALAEEGILFREAHAAAPWTLASHMSLMTGRYPSRHGVDFDERSLSPDVRTLAETLSKRGYRSAGFVSHYYLEGRFGFSRGFAERYEYRQYVNSLSHPDKNVRGDHVIREASKYLEQTRDDGRPYFLFVHLFDPHWTYGAPPPFAGRYTSGYRGKMDGTIRSIINHIDVRKKLLAPADLQHIVDLYDEEIAFTDHLVGQLVAKVRSLPQGDRAVIILTSDHGEEFLEHGALGHGTTLYREQSHVPLIVSLPDGPAGKEISSVISNVDVAPTICRIAGVSTDDPFWSGIDGVPLQLRWAADGAAATRIPVNIENTRWGTPRAAVIFEGHKAISPMAYDWIGYVVENGQRVQRVVSSWQRPLEIYDVVKDAAETKPLPLTPSPRALELLRDWQDRSWRGVCLNLRVSNGWKVMLRFPEDCQWRDEPTVDDGILIRELELRDGVITLQSVRSTNPIRVLLPVDPSVVERLVVVGVSGSAEFHIGAESQQVSAGETRELPLAGAMGAEDGGLPETPSHVRVRARPFQRQPQPMMLDPEVQRILDTMGYLRRR